MFIIIINNILETHGEENLYIGCNVAVFLKLVRNNIA